MRILFIDILTDDLALRKKIEATTYNGKTYADRWQKAFGLSKKDFTVIDASLGVYPDPRKYDAVVIGGSVENPVDPKNDKPWMKKTFAFIRAIAKTDMPLLGVCGGLQFTARALGAEIIFNPCGRRIGTQMVSLTATGRKDPLFVGLPNQFRVAATHRCILKKPLASWNVLTTQTLSPYDAIAIGKHIRLLQFHPEMTCGIIKKIATSRRSELKREGLKQPEICLSDRAGKKILKNFLRLVTQTKNSR